MKRHNLLFLYIMELCAGFARGSYLVCIGWTTLVVSGDVAVVGQIFIVAMLTNIITGPIVGILVDRYNRKDLTIIAHLCIAISLASLGFALAHNNALSMFWFFLAVISASFFRLLYQGAHDGLIHANVKTKDLVHSVARFRGMHLLATAVGTLLTGIIIENRSPSAGFLFSAMTSTLLILAVAFVKGVTSKENKNGIHGFIQDFSGSLSLLRETPALPALVILAGIALPIGQLSNAILSSFIHKDLGLGSDVFGFVDAAWPIGGMIAAAVLSVKRQSLSEKNMEYVFALLVGLVTIVFSFMTAVLSLAIVHAILGFLVWVCRIVIDSRILQICTNQTVGRTKAYIDIIFSLSAMLMCLSPSLVKLPSTSDYFLFWGMIIMLFTGVAALKREPLPKE